MLVSSKDSQTVLHSPSSSDISYDVKSQLDELEDRLR